MFVWATSELKLNTYDIIFNFSINNYFLKKYYQHDTKNIGLKPLYYYEEFHTFGSYQYYLYLFNFDIIETNSFYLKSAHDNVIKKSW